MTPADLIQAYGLTNRRINRALHHVQPETVAAYAAAIERQIAGDSVAAYVACRQVERDIIREERPWRRLVRWLSRKLEVAYWLGLSEARHVINETTSGLISQNPNDW